MSDGTASIGSTTISRRRRCIAVVSVLVVVLGLSACMVTLGGPNPNRVGAFDYEDDVVPLVDRVMVEALGPPSADAFMELMAEGAAPEAELEATLDRLAAGFGEWSGQYSIDEHRRAPDQSFTEFGPEQLELMEVYVDTRFAEGAARVRLLFGDVDGSLELIRWDANLVS